MRVSLPPALYALASGAFAIGATEFMPAAMLPEIAGNLDVSLSRAGLLISGYAFGVTIMTPVLTSVLARFPRRGLLIGLMALVAVANALAALAPGYGFLLVVRFLTSFSHGTYLATATTAAAGLAPKGRSAQAISVVFAGLTIAMATVVPLAAWISATLGWRVAFTGVAVLSVGAVGAIALSVPDFPMGAQRASGRDIGRALREPRLQFAFGMTIVGFAGTFVAFTYLTPYLKQVVGMSAGGSALLLASLGIAVSVGNLLGGRFVEGRIYPGLATLFGLLALSLFSIGLTAGSPILTGIAVVLFGMVMLSTGAGLQSLAIREASLLGSGVADVASGLSQSAFNLGIVLGSFVGGRVVDSTLGLRGAPVVGGGIAALAVVLTLVAWSFERRNPHPAETHPVEPIAA